MSTTSFCKTITIHWGEKKSDSLTTFHTQGVKGHWGEKKKLQTFSTSHSESHPNRLSKWKLSNYFTTQKKFSASLFSFLNRRWRTVEDVIAVVSHNIRFNWQKSREKIKWSETGWTNEHAQPFRCHWWPVFLCSKVLEQNWQVYKQKECPY